MAFRYTDQCREEYYALGFTVLRGLIPASLLTDLRAETDKAREIARQKYGQQTQRLQPVYAYEALKHSAFRDFLNLPGLQETVRNVLSEGHQPTTNMGVLLEPAEAAWCTHWHRDWGYNATPMDIAAFFYAVKHQPHMFNQLNGALYDDTSLWVVPGSHNREDTEAERAAFPRIPPPAPELSPEMSLEARELACSAYARSMPDAIPVALQAGDVAFYRACLWHLGTYIPYTKRATLHDGFYCEDDLKWQAAVREMRETGANVMRWEGREAAG